MLPGISLGTSPNSQMTGSSDIIKMSKNTHFGQLASTAICVQLCPNAGAVSIGEAWAEGEHSQTIVLFLFLFCFFSQLPYGPGYPPVTMPYTHDFDPFQSTSRQPPCHSPRDPEMASREGHMTSIVLLRTCTNYSPFSWLPFVSTILSGLKWG